MTRIRSFVSLWVAAVLSGCAYAWSSPRPQAQSIIETRPSQVRVTRTDGSRLIVQQPRIQGDSLLGWMVAVGSSDLPSAGAIPLSDVRSVDTREFSVLLTALRVVLAGAAAYGLSYALFALTLGSMRGL